MPSLKANERRSGTLVERAYRLIKHGILRGEFPEGSFLNEAEILVRCGIGRTPFREACNRLAQRTIAGGSSAARILGAGTQLSSRSGSS